MNSLSPLRLDVRRLAAAQERQSGEWPAQLLPRWQGSAHADAAAEGAGPVRWAFELGTQLDATGRERPWMRLDLDAHTPLECQRCLRLMRWPVQVRQQYRFVGTEAQALEEDADSDDEVLALEQPLDFPALVEDELLMALPMVPMHDSCPESIQTQYESPHFEDKPRPFAALARLKEKGAD